MLTGGLISHDYSGSNMPVASPGDSAESSLSITESSIDAYAELTGDDNPIHLDDDYAGETFFGGRVAHGMFTAGAVSAALADLPGDVVYLSQDLNFENPVRPGQTVTATVTVTEQLGDDRLRVDTVAETDEERVLSGEAVVMSLPHESE